MLTKNVMSAPSSRPLADKKSMRSTQVSRVPLGALRAIARRRIRPSRFLLTVSVDQQAVTLWEKSKSPTPSKRKSAVSNYEFREHYIASTSRFGIGQKIDSNRTPLGLHRIARKIGGDQPEGTVFKARVPIGTLADMPGATIVHRILWLAGLEPGLNRGGDVDTFRRYIYIHGFGDETTLGRPMSCGCIHLAAADLIPLYERVPTGTLVWIGRR
jgi:L,D-transpeptidase catalytic domain